jgi:GTPase
LFGGIPPEAIVTYTKLKRGVAVTDGAAGTFALTIGDNTTADNVMVAAAGDVDGGTTTLVVNKAAYVNGGTFKATLTGSVNLNTVTAGTFEATVFFIA